MLKLNMIKSLDYILLCFITLLDYSNCAMKEYCLLETFNPSCDDGEVIVMTKAVYGRMRVGKCVPKDLGYIGCQKNVMHVLDPVCSGKQSCAYPIMSEAFVKTQPCETGVQAYLEADFVCKKVVKPQMDCRQPTDISLLDRTGTISSFVSNQLLCGRDKTIWTFDLNPGQQVNISILDFDRNINRNKKSCEALGYISEKGHIGNVSICRTSNRKHHVYTSNGRSLSVTLFKIHTDASEYLLEYNVFGCPDIRVPSNVWYKREGEYATIGCERSDKIWKIRCRIDKWEGVVGNCTERIYHADKDKDDNTADGLSLNKDFWFWIIIIVCLGVGILCVLCLVIIIVKCKRGNGSNPSTDKCGSDESHYRGLIRAQDAPPGYYPTGSTFSQTMPRNPNVSYPQHFATVQSGGRAPNYFVLDQEYMNMKDQNQV